MGRITAPFGIKGWVKVQPFTAAPENLLAYPVWSIADEARWQECRVEHAQVQGRSVVAKLAGCNDRNAAEVYRGREVAVPRESLPAAATNEFYWSDLVGLKVVNTAHEDLGTVSQVFGNRRERRAGGGRRSRAADSVHRAGGA